MREESFKPFNRLFAISLGMLRYAARPNHYYFRFTGKADDFMTFGDS
jgi:hypothetical protein